jgi:hypothetical protein
MTPPIKEQHAAGRRSKTSAGKEYVKAMKAAITYVEAVRACIRSDPFLRKQERNLKPVRLWQNFVTKWVAFAGIKSVIRSSPQRFPEPDSVVLRKDFLYFFQENVSLDFSVREPHTDPRTERLATPIPSQRRQNRKLKRASSTVS